MKMRTLLFVVMCGAAITTVVAGGQNAPAQAALEAARYKAVFDRDLAGAIAQYEAIVDRYRTTDPSAAAQALLAIADSYQKLDDARARPTYERIVREFGDRPEAARASAWLAASPQAAAGGIVDYRRLWTGSDVNLEGQPSEDGR